MSNSNPLAQLHDAGQSPWLDFIQKSLLDGELQRMIREDGLRGLTSNPAIFEKAIADSDEYDAQIARIVAADPGIDDLELFNRLAIPDIQGACDAFHDVWQASGGIDGMVSMEVTPNLAHDADGTVAMGESLHARIDRPNVMIKVPGTRAGVSAFERLTAKGINVNVTLLFSIARYREIAQAWIRGVQQALADGRDVSRLSSVASFFVSRVDGAVDKALLADGSEAALALKGQIAIANAKVAYGHFANLFGSEQFAALKARGAQPQRLLWASTGTKDPDYSDVLYVEELIGPDTVNTLPPATLEAFRDHGTVKPRLLEGLGEAHRQLSALTDLGISLDDITDELEAQGIDSFAEAFERLLGALARQRKTAAAN